MRRFVIGILVIRLSQSGSIVNETLLLRPLQVLQNFPRAEGFTRRSLSLQREILYQNRLPKIHWVATVEGEKGIG
jgi:hypothetical protein